MTSRFIFVLCLINLGHIQALTQVPPAGTGQNDSLVNIDILHANKFEMRKVDDSTKLEILAGSVQLQQERSKFWCDSCVINTRLKTFESWGHVHINDADTADITASHLLYFIDRKFANLDGGVALSDKKGSLTTPDLTYDLNTDIGIYTHGGKVINNKTTLTSREGYYYAGLHDVYFKKNVELKDPGYFLQSDSLLYNTESGIARFIAETFIRDSSGRTITTREGFYNLNSGQAEFGRRPVIVDGKKKITANNITIDSSGIYHARGNVVIIDSVQQITIVSGEAFSDNKKEAFLATNKPLMILKQDNDSIYITADTLFSARLTDLYAKKDTVVKEKISSIKLTDINKTDSTNRYFEAFRHVRVFSDSLQAAGDSLFYSFRDSVFRLYQQPVVWAKQSQITGDTILVFTKNKKADRMKVFENSFMVNEVKPQIYNQVRSVRMDGYFTEGELDSVHAVGFAECIYYIQDEDSAFTGINQSSSDVMDIYFHARELQKVVFRSKVTGTVWPMSQKTPSEMRLKDFQWLESRRPKTKFELME